MNECACVCHNGKKRIKVEKKKSFSVELHGIDHESESYVCVCVCYTEISRKTEEDSKTGTFLMSVMNFSALYDTILVKYCMLIKFINEFFWVPFRN